MLMMKYGNGIEVPAVIADGFRDSKNKMMCAIFRYPNDGELSLRELKTTKYDLNLINELIRQNGWKKEGGEFAIVDDSGHIVYQTLGSNFSIEVDRNGYMHINNDELIVHAHKAGYVYGKTKEEADEDYRICVKTGFYYQDKNFTENGFISEKKETEFKDTIMGKMTKDAIIAWGENNENGEWFVPTNEQAETMLSDGGLKMGDLIIDYSSSEKATNGKTYGSEIAAIDGLVELMAKSEGLAIKQKIELKEKLKSEIYTESSLSHELSTRIKYAMGEKGIEASVLEVLGTIHDNWVKVNGNKFDDPKRAKKLYQFTDLRMMSYGGDGATADLLFLQPILEGAGIELDVKGKLQEEFEKEQKEYMEEHGISDSRGLRDYLRNLGDNYPVVDGVTTTKGKTIEPTTITGELQKSEILERMTEQVAGKIGLEYEREITTEEIGEVAESVTIENVNKAINTITSLEQRNKEEKSIDEK